jgi:ribosomal protein S18 acetylase RimI-like enzyme
MKIRPATVADRSDVLAIDHLAQTRLAFIDRVLSSGTCFVAEVDGRVVAYASLEYTFYEQGFISMVYVADPDRRRGIGRALTEAVVRRCKTRKVFTSTNQSNRAMQRLLSGIGFVPSGTISNLDEGDPELVYFLDLKR